MIATLARRGRRARAGRLRSAPPTRTPASSSTDHIRISTSASRRSSTSAALKADWGVAPRAGRRPAGPDRRHRPTTSRASPASASRPAPSCSRSSATWRTCSPTSTRSPARSARRTSATTPRRPAWPASSSPSARTCRSSSTGRRSGRRGPDVKALKALCIECGFHRFLDELGRARTKPAEAAWESATTGSSTRPRRFGDFVAELERQPKFCLDTETTALDPLRADLVGLSFCWEAGEALLPPGPRARSGASVLDPRRDARGAPRRS